MEWPFLVKISFLAHHSCLRLETLTHVISTPQNLNSGDVCLFQVLLLSDCLTKWSYSGTVVSEPVHGASQMWSYTVPQICVWRKCVYQGWDTVWIAPRRSDSCHSKYMGILPQTLGQIGLPYFPLHETLCCITCRNQQVQLILDCDGLLENTPGEFCLCCIYSSKIDDSLTSVNSFCECVAGVDLAQLGVIHQRGRPLAEMQQV